MMFAGDGTKVPTEGAKLSGARLMLVTMMPMLMRDRERTELWRDLSFIGAEGAQQRDAAQTLRQKDRDENCCASDIHLVCDIMSVYLCIFSREKVLFIGLIAFSYSP